MKTIFALITVFILISFTWAANTAPNVVIILADDTSHANDRSRSHQIQGPGEVLR